MSNSLPQLEQPLRVQQHTQRWWSTAVELGRVSNLPTVWTNVIAGILLSGTQLQWSAGGSWLLLSGLILAMSCAYTGGMYLNDAFDQAFDREHRKNRPIPAGVVSTQTVFVVGYSLLALSVWLVHAVSDSLPATLTAGLLCALIVTYNRWHKRNPLSPVLMGLCRGTVLVCCALAVSRTLGTAVILGAMIMVFYIIGLTACAKNEGKSKRRRAWPIACLASPLVLMLLIESDSAVSSMAAGCIAIWTAFMLAQFSRDNRQPSIACLIAGICLVDALLIVVLAVQNLDITNSSILAAASICATGYVLCRYWQRFISGT